jgi:hypothetical protein
MKQFLFVFLFITFFITGNCQTASTTASGRVNVIQPLSITSTGGALNFGEIILTGSIASYQITPAQGQQFRITGNPGRSVSIAFNQISLSNSVWVSLNGGTVGSLTFTPTVVNSLDNPITSGNFYALVTNGAVAILDIRVGGSITVSSTQPQGDYTGIFTISVSY